MSHRPAERLAVHGRLPPWNSHHDKQHSCHCRACRWRGARATRVSADRRLVPFTCGRRPPLTEDRGSPEAGNHRRRGSGQGVGTHGEAPRKTYKQRRAEAAAARDARRREGAEAARKPDPTGGVYDPVKPPPGKP